VIRRTGPSVAHRIDPPPGDYDWTEALVLTCACAVLQQVHGRPRSVAVFTEEQFETWRASVRIHRDAWRSYVQRASGDAVRASLLYERQGRAVGWWNGSGIPPTPTIPYITPAEAAQVLCQISDDPEQWALRLLRAVRRRRQAPAA